MKAYLRQRVLLTLSLVLTAASLLALYRGYFHEPPQPRLGASGSAIVTPPLTQRLLIVLGDSVRKAPMLDPEIAPFFQEVGRRGIRGDMMVPGPSLTGISVTCFGTGVTPPLKTAMTNFVVPPWPDEDLFDLFDERELKVGFFGDSTWYEAFDRDCEWRCVYPFTGFDVEISDDWYKRDLEVIKAVDEVIEDPSWNVLVVHFSSPDKLAHKFGATLRDASGALTPYSRSIRNIDALTRSWMERAGPETTLFSISDHGCSEAGTHGGFGDITRRTRFAACGPGIRPLSDEVNLEGVELAPIWAALFGLRGPRCGEAPLRHELLTLADGEAIAIHRAALTAQVEHARLLHGGLDLDFEGTLSAARATAPDKTAEFARDLQSRSAAFQSELVTKRKEDGRFFRRTCALLIFLLVVGSTVWFARFHLEIEALSRRRLLIVAVLFAAAFTALHVGRNYWAYFLMSQFRMLFGISPWFATGIFVALGYGIRRLFAALRKRFLAHRSHGVWATWRDLFWVFFFFLTSYFTVAWAFGPKIETYAALFALALGAHLGAPEPRGARWLLVAGIITAVLCGLAGEWIDPKTEVAYRIPGATSQAWSANLGFAACCLVVLGFGRRRLPSAFSALVRSTALALFVFVLATAARETSSIVLGWSSFAAFLLGVFFLPRPRPDKDYPLAARSLATGLLFLALYRLFVVDANFVFGLLFALGALFLGAGLARGRIAALPALTTVLLYEMFYWFVQGYRYKLSTFDMNSAFVFAEGEVNMALSLVAISLQHAAPLAIALAAFFACQHKDDDKIGFASIAYLYAARIGLSFCVLIFFENEGWYFLRSAHFQFFEGMELMAALITTGLIAGAATLRAGPATSRLDAKS